MRLGQGGSRRPRLRFARVALWAFAMSVCAAGATADEPPAAPLPQSLILISVDTLRADRLGSYGYDRETSPALDALAKRGARFETVIAESSWTLPSHATMLSGLPPTVHGARQKDSKLGDDVPLLAERLAARGFRTFALTGGVFVARRHGLARGFEHWDERGLELAPTLGNAILRLAQLDPSERFFLFVHTYAVHCPYEPPDSYAARFQRRPPEDFIETEGRCGNPHYNSMTVTKGQAAYISDRYDASIRYADDLIGEFLGMLDRSGVTQRALVVVLSDHGDEFLEHGRIGHRGSLHIQSLRIPWIVAGPGIAPQVVAQPAALVDVVPTLLELLGLPVPSDVTGRSLAPFLRGEGDADPARLLASETEWGRQLHGAISGPHHLIVDRETGQELYFDWHADPAEASPRPPGAATWMGPLRRATVAWWERSREGRTADVESIPGLSDAERARLEALGYVDP